MSGKLKNLWRMAAGPVRERGLVETVRSVRSCLSARKRERSDPFDAEFGTDTEHAVTVADLDATGPDIPALWRYWPTSRNSFERIMSDVAIPYEKSVFVDLGSGKGRVLLMASEYPFRKIIGVELSPALHQIAEANVRAWRSPTRLCDDIELRCMDAGDFTLPPGDALVYLFQPFPAETMRVVLERFGRGLQSQPGVVRLAYLNPLHHELILQSGHFALEHWGQGVDKGEFDWVIYSSEKRLRAA
jgi:SAM-dependent methyltransferase